MDGVVAVGADAGVSVSRPGLSPRPAAFRQGEHGVQAEPPRPPRRLDRVFAARLEQDCQPVLPGDELDAGYYFACLGVYEGVSLVEGFEEGFAVGVPDDRLGFAGPVGLYPGEELPLVGDLGGRVASGPVEGGDFRPVGQLGGEGVDLQGVHDILEGGLAVVGR